MLRSSLLRSTRVACAAALPRVPLAAPSTRLAPAATAVRAQATRTFSDERTPFIPKPVFSSYKIYKSKTALDFVPIKAQLGWNSPHVEERKWLALKRAGGFKLTFAAGENRHYDWTNGNMITLSVTELGDVLAFHADKSQAEHKFFHDPNLGGEDAGRTRKELVLKRIGAGKPGYFFNFAVTDKDAGQKRWSIAISEGEMCVLVTLIQQTMPALLALQTKAGIWRHSDEEGGEGNNWGSK